MGQHEDYETNYTIRAKGRKDRIEEFFARIHGNEMTGARFGASLRILHEDGDCVLADIGGHCDGTLSEVVKGLYESEDGQGALDFPGIAHRLGLEMEAFSTGQYGEGTYDYCEHIHANAEGELIAHELEDVYDIIDWDPEEETIEEVLEDFGFDPDDQEDVVELPDDVLIIGCSIEMYRWSQGLGV